MGGNTKTRGRQKHFLVGQRLMLPLDVITVLRLDCSSCNSTDSATVFDRQFKSVRNTERSWHGYEMKSKLHKVAIV